MAVKCISWLEGYSEFKRKKILLIGPCFDSRGFLLWRRGEIGLNGISYCARWYLNLTLSNTLSPWMNPGLQKVDNHPDSRSNIDDSVVTSSTIEPTEYSVAASVVWKVITDFKYRLSMHTTLLNVRLGVARDTFRDGSGGAVAQKSWQRSMAWHK